MRAASENGKKMNKIKLYFFFHVDSKVGDPYCWSQWRAITVVHSIAINVTNTSEY
jgi:hypothetical protein